MEQPLMEQITAVWEIGKLGRSRRRRLARYVVTTAYEIG
jgi:hypothetical protein